MTSKYSELTDWEINVAVAKCLGYAASPNKYHPTSVVTNYGNGRRGLNSHDYCNSWSDMGPIIVENKISLVELSSVATGWKAQAMHLEGKPHSSNPSPLRAAAIVYLMIKGER